MPSCNVCGYAVEWLRSCYRSLWRFSRRQGTPGAGEYYFSPPGTPFYPGLHNFGSDNWLNEDERVNILQDDLLTLGEIRPSVPRLYRDGELPSPVALPGVNGSAECIAGNLESYEPIGHTSIHGFDDR